MSDEKKDKPVKTGQQLCEKLEDSGTRGQKLEQCKMAVARDPTMTARELYDLMKKHGTNPVTLQKAAGFLGEDTPVEQVVPLPVNAPVGGVQIGDRFFNAGESIPRSALEGASLDELRRLHNLGAPLELAVKQAEEEEGDEEKKAAKKKLTAEERIEREKDVGYTPTHPVHTGHVAAEEKKGAKK